ncbi:hypothetical protein LC605_15105 [Nostoc sp. CHAB 5836]|uniref:hypothetical protein n=1 Tax=Nostoc sp. CHAB 5836 TaxID=2780404 RepID=UPI001E4CD972|nr:hypothetical protein [Nostoc sp. CHAB 5836]MCC5616374.1 hypothetical protein [Nostoc sp. CHAB 5836]
MSYPLVALFSRANFSSTYTRTRKGKREIVRKKVRSSLVARLLGPNRAKYTEPQRNMRIAQDLAQSQRARKSASEARLIQKAQQAYQQSKPGLLEKWGVIPNRRASYSAQFSSTYTRTRNGKRQVVRKAQNRLKVERGRVSARVSVPMKDGEVYGLGVGLVRRDRRNIREEFKPSIGQRGIGITAQGNAGNYQLKARGYTGYNPNFSQFSEGNTYTRRTKTGKLAIVRKGKRRGVSGIRVIAGVSGGATLLGFGALALLATRGKPGVANKVFRSSSDDVAKAASSNVKAEVQVAKERAKQYVGTVEDVERNLNSPSHVWEF